MIEHERHEMKGQGHFKKIITSHVSSLQVQHFGNKKFNIRAVYLM